MTKEATLNFDVYLEDIVKQLRTRAKGSIDDYIDSMRNYFNLTGEIFSKGQEIKELDDFIQHVKVKDVDKIAESLQIDIENRDQTQEKIIKSMSNIFVQMRFTKAYVEISMKNVVNLLLDAILINKEIIDKKNQRILALGKEKVKLLTANLDQKNRVEELRYELMKKDLKIEVDIIISMAITRLKVTKTLQAALAKNETHMSEVSLFK